MMIRLCRRLTVTIAVCALLGCTTQGNPLNRTPSVPVSGTDRTAAQTATRPGEDPQTAYRRELLNNQLRHAQMDLQAATNESERQSIQERIDMIQQVLASLDQR
jgi:hypothetical protein